MVKICLGCFPKNIWRKITYLYIRYLWSVPRVAAYTAFASVRLVLSREAAAIQFVVIVIWRWIEAISMEKSVRVFNWFHCDFFKKKTYLHMDALEGGSISRPWPLVSLYSSAHRKNPITSFGPKIIMICRKKVKR